MLEDHATAAHVADSVEPEPLVEALGLPEGTLVLGDKGYAGERNEVMLVARWLKNGDMEKAWPSLPLSKQATTRNLLIGKLRYKEVIKR